MLHKDTKKQKTAEKKRATVRSTLDLDVAKAAENNMTYSEYDGWRQSGWSETYRRQLMLEKERDKSPGNIIESGGDRSMRIFKAVLIAAIMSMLICTARGMMEGVMKL